MFIEHIFGLIHVLTGLAFWGAWDCSTFSFPAGIRISFFISNFFFVLFFCYEAVLGSGIGATIIPAEPFPFLSLHGMECCAFQIARWDHQFGFGSEHAGVLVRGLFSSDFSLHYIFQVSSTNFFLLYPFFLMTHF